MIKSVYHVIFVDLKWKNSDTILPCIFKKCFRFSKALFSLFGQVFFGLFSCLRIEAIFFGLGNIIQYAGLKFSLFGQIFGRYFFLPPDWNLEPSFLALIYLDSQLSIFAFSSFFETFLRFNFLKISTFYNGEFFLQDQVLLWQFEQFIEILKCHWHIGATIAHIAGLVAMSDVANPFCPLVHHLFALFQSF